MFLHDYHLACEISMVRTFALRDLYTWSAAYVERIVRVDGGSAGPDAGLAELLIYVQQHCVLGLLSFK